MAENEFDPRHSHEPELAPVFDVEGRCLICALSVLTEERDAARAEQDALIARRWEGALGKIIEFGPTIDALKGCAQILRADPFRKRDPWNPRGMADQLDRAVALLEVTSTSEVEIERIVERHADRAEQAEAELARVKEALEQSERIEKRLHERMGEAADRDQGRAVRAEADARELYENLEAVLHHDCGKLRGGALLTRLSKYQPTEERKEGDADAGLVHDDSSTDVATPPVHEAGSTGEREGTDSAASSLSPDQALRNIANLCRDPRPHDAQDILDICAAALHSTAEPRAEECQRICEALEREIGFHRQRACVYRHQDSDVADEHDRSADRLQALLDSTPSARSGGEQ